MLPEVPQDRASRSSPLASRAVAVVPARGCSGHMPTTLSTAQTFLRRWSLWSKEAVGHLSTGVSWGWDRERASTSSLCFCIGFRVKGPRFGEVSSGSVVLALDPAILLVLKRLLYPSPWHAHLRVPPARLLRSTGLRARHSGSRIPLNFPTTYWLREPRCLEVTLLGSGKARV